MMTPQILMVFMLQELESLPDRFNPSGPSGQLNQVSRNFVYISSKKDNGINYEKVLVNLSTPIRGKSYIGAILPTYRNIEEAIIQEKKDIVSYRKSILLSVALIVMSAGSFAGVYLASRESAYLYGKEKEEVKKISDSNCSYGFDDIGEIGVQEDFDHWNDCMSNVRSMKPEDVCYHTYWYLDHGYCAQNDLNQWCYNKGNKNPRILVTGRNIDSASLSIKRERITSLIQIRRLDLVF